MAPPTKAVPRAIPGIVDDDKTPPPHDLGAGAQLAWNHAESIGRRVALAVEEQVAELAAKITALQPPAAAQAPAAAPARSQMALVLQTLGIVLALLSVAFVLYRELGTLAVKVDTLTEQQQRGDEAAARRMERIEDRVYDLQAGRSSLPAPVPGP